MKGVGVGANVPEATNTCESLAFRVGGGGGGGSGGVLYTQLTCSNCYYINTSINLWQHLKLYH